MKNDTKKILSICIKVAILVLATWYIFNTLNDNRGLTNFMILLRSLNQKSVWIVLSSLVILMFLNWYLEALKWKFLVNRVEVISTWKAVESVFCGLTWAVFTPNRIGEYGGRVFFLSANKRIKGALAMTVGAFGQLVVISVLGAIALRWFVIKFMQLNPIMNLSISILAIVFSLFFLLFYFNIHWLSGLLSKINFMKQYKHFFIIFASFKVSELLRVLLYCLSRILIFTTQYFLIIHFLIPQIDTLDMVLILFIFYFIQSSMPSLDLLDIGLRATTAGYFFSYVSDQEIAVMAAIASIWFINLVLPAIFGSIFVLKLNFFDSNRS